MGVGRKGRNIEEKRVEEKKEECTVSALSA
jgi:hypothetical protein